MEDGARSTGGGLVADWPPLHSACRQPLVRPSIQRRGPGLEEVMACTSHGDAIETLRSRRHPGSLARTCAGIRRVFVWWLMTDADLFGEKSIVS